MTVHSVYVKFARLALGQTHGAASSIAIGRREWNAAMVRPKKKKPRIAGLHFRAARRRPRRRVLAPQYSTFGSQSPMPGNRYRITIATICMPMNGSMPRKIWFSVTCGGETPFR